MDKNVKLRPLALRKDGKALAVRFPVPTTAQRLTSEPWTRLGKFLPLRWRRRVVIQGKRFWLPG